MGRAQHVKRRWRSRENWPRNIAAKTTGPVSTCTPTRQTSSIPGVDVTGPCNCHRADGTDSTCRPTLMASREPNDFPLHSARNYRPIDAIWLRSQSGRPSAVTVPTCAPCKHYRTFATLWSVNASVDHCSFVMTAKTGFGSCCLYYVCSLCLEFLRYLTNEKNLISWWYDCEECLVLITFIASILQI